MTHQECFKGTKYKVMVIHKDSVSSHTSTRTYMYLYANHLMKLNIHLEWMLENPYADTVFCFLFEESLNDDYRSETSTIWQAINEICENLSIPSSIRHWSHDYKQLRIIYNVHGSKIKYLDNELFYVII